MKIKITPFNNQEEQLEKLIKIGNNFYGGGSDYCGIITEIKKSDDWLEQEMPWVSRSEIPFLTALRLAQIYDEHQGNLVSGLTPFVQKYGIVYTVKEVNTFPNADSCKKVLEEHCFFLCDSSYSFHKRKVTNTDITEILRAFDYKSNLIIRSGSCLYKANLLLSKSSAFAEDVYINTSIAFEGIIEYLRLKHKMNRKKVVGKITKFGVQNFPEYEEEMRDMIRNDIIHPYRKHEGRKIAQPFIMADYIFEDLGFVDWLFKQVLLNKV